MLRKLFGFQRNKILYKDTTNESSDSDIKIPMVAE